MSKQRCEDECKWKSQEMEPTAGLTRDAGGGFGERLAVAS